MKKKESILISVIVPIYNNENFLEKCIESILNQTFKNFELLLINDGSIDKSLEICNKYYIKNKNKIRVFDLSNQGCSAARNLGIREAKGKYLLFVDSDDWIEKTMLEEMYTKAVEENADVVIVGITREEIINNRIILETPFQNNEDKYFWFSNEALLAYACNKLYIKKAIKDNFLEYNENISCGEDLLFNIQCIVNMKKISILEKNLYHYVIHGGNSVFNLERRKEIFTTFNFLHEYLYKKNFLENKEILDKFRGVTVKHIKYSFRKLLYYNEKRIFIKSFKEFIQNTKKLKFLNFNSKLEIYIRAIVIFFIYFLNLNFLLKIK